MFIYYIEQSAIVNRHKFYLLKLNQNVFYFYYIMVINSFVLSYVLCIFYIHVDYYNYSC
jgi:hypothetical protein